MLPHYIWHYNCFHFPYYSTRFNLNHSALGRVCTHIEAQLAADTQKTIHTVYRVVAWHHIKSHSPPPPPHGSFVRTRFTSPPALLCAFAIRVGIGCCWNATVYAFIIKRNWVCTTQTARCIFACVPCWRIFRTLSWASHTHTHTPAVCVRGVRGVHVFRVVRFH